MGRILLILLTIALMLFLRLYALDSDAYPRLSWSSALLTDEGFYIHNARNVLLFGHMRTDGFNNALIMPLLHLLQVGWFRLWGVGAVQARLLSVLMSLLTLVLFFGSLRRVFGVRVACLATLFLGLDHVNVLYNRLALMDTPAAFWMVAAFAAFTRIGNREAAEDNRAEERGKKDEERVGKREEGHIDAEVRRRGRTLFPFPISLLPAFCCGLLLGAGYATRGLVLFLFPVPFLLLLWQVLQTQGERRWLWWREVGALSAGLALAMGLYIVVWFLPHLSALRFVNHYYYLYQLIPFGISGILKSIQRGFFNNRGICPFMLKHTPVLLMLALSWLPLVRKYSRFENREEGFRLSVAFLVLWLFFGLGTMLVIWYAPSRYYVTFFPPLAALAALSIEELRRSLEERNVRWRYLSPYVPLLCVVLWGVINVDWMADWALHLTYRQQAADRWLGENLPSNSVLFGAVAPGLCMNNHLHVVQVQEALCNDDHPVESYGQVPRYILLLDGRWKERWWIRHYPCLVQSSAEIHVFPQLLRPFFYVGVYAVPPDFPTRVGAGEGMARGAH